MDQKIKKLKIQTGVVKRPGKEKLSYRKEADMQKAKVEKMKADGRDECEVKKMNECMQESLMMIPDCHRRLENAIPELKAILNEFNSEEYNGNGDVLAAKKALEDSEEHLKAQ
uniref:Tubulin-specific chaperone A n=1 Tax=Lepeophtheirus salmonis TaxID=72036 RepID=D3PI18_LEPSM|nr:Tubulin-specific chaperone A [Lepeophtheirus salmonis]